MSGLLDLHLDKVADPVAVPGGESYELKITSSKIAPSKSSDRNLIKVSYEIIGHPTASAVFDNMSLPMAGDDEKKVYFFQMNLKKFCQAFGLDLKDPGNPGDWVGLTAWNTLKQGENEQTGEIENNIGRWDIKK